MNSLRVKKSALYGSIHIPPSKSQTLRAILFGSLGRGKTIVHNYLPSPDTLSMIEACRTFGAKIDILDAHLEIEGIDGKIIGSEDVLNAGNSGIVLRFCSALGSLSSLPVVITGDFSIRHRRPMAPFFEACSSLGVRIESMRGDFFAPLIIKGPFLGGKATFLGKDSQHVSALLIAAAFAEKETMLEVREPGETPWVDLTLAWFDRLQIKYEREGFHSYKVYGKSSYAGFTYKVPGDVSSAAYPIAAALITQSELHLTNIDLEDRQGDKELITVFQKMGADIAIDRATQSLYVRRAYKLTGIEVDINNFIDALPILAVVACFAEGTTSIRNAAVARQKESDRITAIVTELRKMGAHIQECEDGLLIQKSCLQGSNLYSHEDHRIALSLAVAGLGAEKDTNIYSCQCIEKTFPAFVSSFLKIGAKIQTLIDDTSV